MGERLKICCLVSKYPQLCVCFGLALQQLCFTLLDAGFWADCLNFHCSTHLNAILVELMSGGEKKAAM